MGRKEQLVVCGAVVLAAALAFNSVSWTALSWRNESPPTPAATPPASASTWRDAALKQARIQLAPVRSVPLHEAPADPTGVLSAARVTCQFIWSAPTGTSAKFDCMLPGGEVVKVKYGRNPEIQAEVAATRLLTALGLGTDRMYLVPQLRCYGCPPFPFPSMRLLHLLGAMREGEPRATTPGQFRDFDWVAVERKFDATAIESAEVKGWAWWELARVTAPRAEIDALRLIAVFLAHWDNKAENQRLVCLDPGYPGDTAPCANPLLIVQDLGATFGPTKVNLARWRSTPVWADQATCRVSMRRTMPWNGGTFPDATISEEARQRVGRALASFTSDDLRRLFAAAHFPQFYSGTDDERDLTMWTEAFRLRVRQILTAGPCPD